jgi:hypothetical protein
LDGAFDFANTVIEKLETPYVVDEGVRHPVPCYIMPEMQKRVMHALAMSSELRPARDVVEKHLTLPILPGFVGAFKLGALRTRIAELLVAVEDLLSYIVTLLGALDSEVPQLHAWTETLKCFRGEMEMLKYNADMVNMLERRGITG